MLPQRIARIHGDCVSDIRNEKKETYAIWHPFQRIPSMRKKTVRTNNPFI